MGTDMSGSTMRIGMLGFEGANAMDLIGPAEAFATATALRQQDRPGKAAYEVLLLGLNRRPFVTESGVLFKPHHHCNEAPPLDTLLVPGGPGLREPRINAAAARWIAQRAPKTRRVVSICTGIFGLAPTGLLDGLRVTTHWRWAARLAQQYPALKVDGDALFIKQGKYYSGGGVTAGIDLALALIEEDLGPHAALAAAREMVVYLKRPGGQEQYSEPLRAQARSADRFAGLIAWIDAHPEADLSVEALAARACLSPRHFSRRFRASLGATPADYVEDARLRRARQRLVQPGRSIDSIAVSLGFSSADVFRRAFERRYGVTPSHYRERFGLPAAARASIQGLPA
jgi:transcriptional regulator GlxA family with amidase domain